MPPVSRHITHQLAITAVEVEGHANDFFVLVADLRAIRAPAKVRLQRNDLAVVTALLEPDCVTGNNSRSCFISRYTRLWFTRLSFAASNRFRRAVILRNPSAPRASYSSRINGKYRSSSWTSAFMATMKAIQKIGARYLQYLRNTLQRVSSGGSNGMCEINFFD